MPLSDPARQDAPDPIPRRGRIAAAGGALQAPAPLSTLVGREREVAEIGRLIRAGARLVTMTGPGGVGKTRLALEVARDLEAAFADGVAVVPLAPVFDPADVPATIARHLGVGEVDGSLVGERLRGYLRSRSLLLVLDNLEHLLPAATEIAGLLEAAPGLAVLATSRIALNVDGEQRAPLEPLALPDETRPHLAEIAAAPAVRLFAARAAAVVPGFAVTEANAPVVARICRRLDGLPLALELAARRLRVLSPEDLLARLEHGLGELVDGERTKPTRLRTMAAAIAWSHDLLAPAEQILFRRLAVFAGGFTPAAAAVVAGEGVPRAVPNSRPAVPTLDGIAALVDASLVRRADGEGGTRFDLLETIREFGLERLAESGEGAEVRARHADWCLDFAVRSYRGQFLGDPAWMVATGHERANLRSALAWAIDTGDAELALRLAGNLWLFWHSGGESREGRGWVEQALTLPGGSAEARAIALECAGPLASAAGETERGDRLLEEAVALRRELGDAPSLARATHLLGIHLQESGDPIRAGACFDVALDLYGEPIDPVILRCRDLAAGQLGWIAAMGGDPDRGLAICETHLVAMRGADFPLGLFIALVFSGMTLLMIGQTRPAQERCREAVALIWSNGERGYNLFGALRASALVTAAGGDHGRALRLAGAVDVQMSDSGIVGNRHFDTAYGRAIATAKEALGPAPAAAALAAGQRMTLAEAVALALDEDVLPAGLPGSEPAPIIAAALGRLTPRELQVLKLLGDGRRDREIGEALFLSRHTAANHLRNLRTELGLRNRAEAAAFAANHAAELDALLAAKLRDRRPPN